MFYKKEQEIYLINYCDFQTEEGRLNRMFPCSYELTSSYKPAPLDLSHVKLASAQEAMVDKLAENAHNVWARDRIGQGWTYGIQQVGSLS